MRPFSRSSTMLSSRALIACIASRLSQKSRPIALSSELPRYFSTSSSRLAKESPASKAFALAEALKNTQTFQNIARSPDALAALQKLGNIMQKQGFDIASGKQPSMLQMSKLMLSSEFREASKNVVAEFEKAGVDVKDKATIEEIQAIMSKAGKAE